MSESARTLAVTMPVTEVLPCPDDSNWVCCLNCGAPLELYQPDTQEPQRFIGTCGQCRRWYLLDWIPQAAEGVMLLLPDHARLLGAFKGEEGGRPDTGSESATATDSEDPT
jgi:hypothetical protein